jgi:hypothetical protein
MRPCEDPTPSPLFLITPLQHSLVYARVEGKGLLTSVCPSRSLPLGWLTEGEGGVEEEPFLAVQLVEREC